MGRTSKRHVLAVAQESITPPDRLQPSQCIVRVIKPEGNNLYLCELPDQRALVLELAQRFRNTIWIRRGGYVLAEQYPAMSEEKRATGEIVNVVRDDKQWRKQPYWPQEFSQDARNPSDDDELNSNVGKLPPSDAEDE